MLPPSLAKLLVEPQVLTPRQLALILALRGVAKGFTEAVLKLVPSGVLREDGFAHFEKAYLCFDTAIRTQVRGLLTADALAAAFGPTEGKDERVARVWMNAAAYSDLRKNAHDRIDTETNMDRLRQGIQGRIWNAEIRTSRHIPEGCLVVIAEDIDPSRLDDARALVHYPDLRPGWVPEESQLIHY